MQNPLVLIIEDDPEIQGILDAYFQRDGFRTVTASNPQIGLSHHQRLKPDLVVLDVKLPGMDGYEVLATLRREAETPVLMVTALSEDLDKLQGLRLGADDYVTKPFNPLEVIARARTILRRSAGSRQSPVLRVGPLVIDTDAHQALVEGAAGPQPLALTPTEFRILYHMGRTPTRAFRRSELIDACLPEGEALDRTLDSHISNLRRKLVAAGAADLLTSVRGIGYRLGRTHA
ncbi:MAG: response regulator [Asticcacaulis sp.]|uniref:response regulator n=1 Tax=Asticcacaulis sp. TaxID=1872648 RepID=UPI0025B9B579|nr:response regulator [Asticcacaulis sp.]MCA1936519.1 response regulator [Asticcacaulis sp.]